MSLRGGGWVTDAGQDGASVLVGFGMTSSTAEPAGTGAGAGALPFPE